MEQNLPQQKWHAEISTTLTRAGADQIWPFFQDFFGINKWFSGLPNCHGIHGVNGEPGCVRYCSGFGLKKPEENSDPIPNNVSWSKERLVAIDHAQKTLSYEIVDCNIGFKNYVSTIKVVPAADGGGCTVEWLISLEAVEGCRLEDLVVKYEVALKLMVKKMEDAIFGTA